MSGGQRPQRRHDRHAGRAQRGHPLEKVPATGLLLHADLLATRASPYYSTSEDAMVLILAGVAIGTIAESDRSGEVIE